MYPILLSFSTHFSTLFINNSSIQNTLSQDNLSQNKILLIFCAACFAGYFIAYIKKRPSALLFVIGRSTAGSARRIVAMGGWQKRSGRLRVAAGNGPGRENSGAARVPGTQCHG